MSVEPDPVWDGATPEGDTSAQATPEGDLFAGATPEGDVFAGVYLGTMTGPDAGALDDPAQPIDYVPGGAE